MSDAAMPNRLPMIDMPSGQKGIVEHMIIECAAVIDNDELEVWPDFFVEDCIYKITTRSNYQRDLPAGFMYCANRRMLIDRVRATRTANIFPPHTYRHILSQPRFLGHQDRALLVETNYLVVRTAIPDGEMTLFSTGKYVDEIVFEQGIPKFKKRIVVCESDSIDMLLVLPI